MPKYEALLRINNQLVTKGDEKCDYETNQPCDWDRVEQLLRLKKAIGIDPVNKISLAKVNHSAFVLNEMIAQLGNFIETPNEL